MSLLIAGATIIDGVSTKPIDGKSIWIEAGRIKAIGNRDELQAAKAARVIEADGKYAIPGLMNANVHLFGLQPLERIARHFDCYEDLIAEAAQVALKGGLTTVFDTWGPRRFLMTVRDQINQNKLPGARVFCAGNIVGFDGPLSIDFFPKAPEVASAVFVKRINAIWVENVGRHLMWLTPAEVANEIRTYIGRGIDFIKYASNDHYPGCFLAFAPRVQVAIVEEAHRAGITAQAHAMTVEGLRAAVEADCDLVTHCNITGPTPIPQETLELMAERGTGAVIFPWTRLGMEWVMKNVSQVERLWWQASDINARNLIRSGAPILLANDGLLLAPEFKTDPQWGRGSAGAPDELSLMSLGHGHFLWFKAMEEKGLDPMEMLKAATRNIAVAYGKGKDLGTLEAGKIADIVLLDKNPLQSAENYSSIHSVIKDGVVINRDDLPLKPVLSGPQDPPAEEESSYIPFVAGGSFPMCPICVRR